MDDLFNKWRNKIPKYSVEFTNLFESLSKKFSGSEKTRVNLGKHFSSNYELYMYAFFLGLYNNEFIPIEESNKKTDFSYAIQFWGSKSTRIDRKDFSILQEHIFAALVAKTDIDLIALEKGEISEDDLIKELLKTMESYTNGGLTLIKEKIEDNPNYFLQPTSFLHMMVEGKVAKQENVK